MSKANGNVPVQTIRNRRIKAAIWSNRSPKGVFFTVTVTRSFRQNDKWHDSYSFSHDELLIVAKLMYDAHTAISKLLETAKQTKPSTSAQPQASTRSRAKA